MNHLTSVIIPNYNGEELLKKNLQKVIDIISSYKDGFIEIIIVDDCSTDKSIEVIENEKLKMKNYSPRGEAGNLKLKIFKNMENLGFSSTVNRGVEESDGDIVVLLNTDVMPKRGFLQPLIRHFTDPLMFAVGCMDKSMENGKIVLRGRGIGRWKKGFLMHKRGEIDKTNTLWVSCGSGAFRKSIWDKLGGLDKLYKPFYWEDIDLSYRASKSGYKILFEPRSVVVHEHEKGSIKKTYSAFQVKTIAYRNQFIFVWKNATDIDLQFLHLLWLPYHFVTALIRGDLNFFIGFYLALLRLPQAIKSSFRAQKYVIKSDKEVVSDFTK